MEFTYYEFLVWVWMDGWMDSLLFGWLCGWMVIRLLTLYEVDDGMVWQGKG